MENQKLYKHKYLGDDVKALETVKEGLCKAWSFNKQKVTFVEVDLYEEMDEDVTSSYDVCSIQYYAD